MSIFVSHGASPRPAAAQPFARAAGLLLLLLFAATAFAAQAGPPRPAPQPEESGDRMRQAKTAPATATPVNEDEESESGDDDGVRTRPRATDPAAVMRTARFVYVRSLTAFVDGREVEDSLRKRKEFRAWGMAITRDEGQADLIIEITRKPLSRRFTFSVVEPRTLAVVTSGKTRSVLFGKKIPNKIAEKFANRVRAVRPF